MHEWREFLLSMKGLFTAGAVVVAIMWAIATLTVPSEIMMDEQGNARRVLTWSTDPNPARREQLEPFHEQHKDLQIMVEPNSFDRTIVQCSTGVGPDIIEIYTTEDMVAYVEAGILLDLTPYAEEMGFGPETTYPKLVGNLMYNGRQYRYPANAASGVLIYNKKKFREAGVPYPEDGMLWEDFIELVKPLTKKKPGGYGYEQFALVMSPDGIKDLMLQHGGRFFSPDKTRCTLDSPESIAAMEFYRDLMLKHEIIPTPGAAKSLSAAGGWGYGEIRWFASGHAASIWGSRWMLVIFRQYPELHEELGVALLPHLPGGVPASVSGARSPGINANSENVEDALKFMQYLASDEYARVIAMSSDGLPPRASYGSDAEKLLNPKYPEEQYQEKFIESMNYAEPMEVSPFVSPIVVTRTWQETYEYVQNDIKSSEQAMKDAAKRLNDLIAKNIREREDLREMYEKAKSSEANVASAQSSP